MASDCQVLLVPSQCRQHHLVYLRLQRLFFRHLRDLDPGQSPRRVGTSVEESGLEHPD